MLNALPITRIRPSGFTLVELLIGIAILGIMLAAAAPGFRVWMQNIQTRTAAESIAQGLQKARAEAVARNTNVAFTLVGADSSWNVSVVAPVEVLEARLAAEGSRNVNLATVPAGATTITFNNLGGVAANANGSMPFTQANLDAAAAGGNINLRVTIGAGGNARMCDPIQVAPDLRAC